MDNLARDCAKALKAGMSYGQWKALHPHTKREAEQAQEKTKPCHWCGNPLPESSQPSRKYCCEKCKEAADRARVRDRYRAKVGIKEGENNSKKLTAQDVMEARHERATKGTSWLKLAERYGVQVSTIRSAINGETWKSLPMEE